jgi:nucleoside-diphosphate-sugar epimerase
MNKKALVLGAGGFIGSHLVTRLKKEGFWVRGVDLKYPDFSPTVADDFIIGDLRDPQIVESVIRLDGIQGYPQRYSRLKKAFTDTLQFDEVYQLAADMGGAGYINTGDNDAEVVHNSMLINLNVVCEASKKSIKKIFYASSACVYNEHNQLDPENPICTENSVYPAQPDSEYGWEKLFSERLYLIYNRNHGLDIRIARFHNIFGPEGTFYGGREKAPAALCRKVAQAKDGDTIEVWGDGLQTRSFLYIDEAIEGIRKLMNSDYKEPVNIGSEEIISMNGLTQLISKLANKNLKIKNIPGPQGVRGRTSDNTLIKEKLGWFPSQPLHVGLTQTYEWIVSKIKS